MNLGGMVKRENGVLDERVKLKLKGEGQGEGEDKDGKVGGMGGFPRTE